MKSIRYAGTEVKLTASSFLGLVQKVWPGDYRPERVQEALAKTQNFTAWEGGSLVGCVRLLSDGYFFSTITEILVDPSYQRMGVGAHLMEMAWKASPGSLSFGVQPGNEAFFKKLGFSRGLDSYEKLKEPR